MHPFRVSTIRVTLPILEEKADTSGTLHIRLSGLGVTERNRLTDTYVPFHAVWWIATVCQ